MMDTSLLLRLLAAHLIGDLQNKKDVSRTEYVLVAHY